MAAIPKQDLVSLLTPPFEMAVLCLLARGDAGLVMYGLVSGISQSTCS